MNELVNGFDTYLREYLSGEKFVDHTERLMDEYYSSPAVKQLPATEVTRYRGSFLSGPWFSRYFGPVLRFHFLVILGKTLRLIERIGAWWKTLRW